MPAWGSHKRYWRQKLTKLFGKTWTEEELLAYVGDVSALGGIRIAELADGPGRGVRVADVRTGGGLFHRADRPRP